MHEVWSQELQCYRTRNVSLLRLKYTCFYLCSVEIVSGPIFRNFLLRPYAKTERKLNASLAGLIRCCPLTQGHSGARENDSLLSRVFRFLVVFILRFVKTGTPIALSYHYPIFGRIQRLKKAKCDGFCSNFLSNKSGILPPLLTSNESLRLDLSFLKVFNRSSS